MKFDGIIAIGNGEKCPHCDVVLTKDIIFPHMRDNHADEMMKALFKTEDDE